MAKTVAENMKTSLRICLISSSIILVNGCDRLIDKAFDPVKILDRQIALPQRPYADETLGIVNAAGVAIHPDGRVFVCNLNGKDGRHFYGQIIVLSDDDEDGFADRYTIFADSLTTAVGVAFRGDDVYVSIYGEVIVLRDDDGDGRADARESVVKLLPWGTHVNNQIAFGPDGMLYITLGSEFDSQEESNPHRATILRVSPDARDLNVRESTQGIEIVASGIRNAFDLAFAPQGHFAEGELFATDNGPEGPAADAAEGVERTQEYESNFPEELNHIIHGGHYGYPDYFGTPPEDSGTIPPIAEFIDHSGAEGLAFNTGDAFPGMEGFLFIAFYHAGEIVALKLNEKGSTFSTEFFTLVEFPCIGDEVGTSFGTGHKPCLHDHPLDLAFGNDGSLFVATFGMIRNDFTPKVYGKIYRITGY